VGRGLDTYLKTKPPESLRETVRALEVILDIGDRRPASWAVVSGDPVRLLARNSMRAHPTLGTGYTDRHTAALFGELEAVSVETHCPSRNSPSPPLTSLIQGRTRPHGAPRPGSVLSYSTSSRERWARSRNTAASCVFVTCPARANQRYTTPHCRLRARLDSIRCSAVPFSEGYSAVCWWPHGRFT
jgi:hypothetical protein